MLIMTFKDVHFYSGSFYIENARFWTSVEPFIILRYGGHPLLKAAPHVYIRALTLNK